MPQESKLPNVLLLMLMSVTVFLMIAIIGLFIKLNQLEREVLVALESLQPAKELSGLEIGTAAPTFVLPDTEGHEVSLNHFIDQRVLLAFSSTRCPACIEMYPHLKAFSENCEDVQVIMVSLGSAEQNKQLVVEQEFGFPVLTWRTEVAKDYQVPGTPFFYVIDRDSVIVNAGFANTVQQLEELID